MAKWDLLLLLTWLDRLFYCIRGLNGHVLTCAVICWPGLLFCYRMLLCSVMRRGVVVLEWVDSPAVGL